MRVSSFTRSRPAWLRFLGAAAVTAVVLLGRMALNGSWGRQHNRHLIFLPAIMLVSWLGRLGPGLLATVMMTLALALWWPDQAHGANIPQSDLVLFFLLGVGLSALIELLQAERARADATTRAHEQVLAIVAHDLGNPLTTIKLTSERLQMAAVDGTAERRHLKTIDRAASRMEHLIRDLVDSTRIEQDGLKLTMQDEKLDAIIQETLDSFTPLAAERRIELQVSRSYEDGVIPCDRERLLQALGNLLGNAFKFTPEGGRVRLRASREPGRVRFEVEDTGKGIDARDIPHLFERYWKADPRGTGLGLYIANSIVRAHGGAMSVRSQPGRGSTFTFTVPSQASSAAPASDGAPARDDAPARDGTPARDGAPARDGTPARDGAGASIPVTDR
jgi:signal transduction histidine kinase